MDFLPGEGHTLHVVRVVVGDLFVTNEAFDARCVFRDNRNADETLTTWEGLLLGHHLAEQRLFLDCLGKAFTLDVEVKSSVCY